MVASKDERETGTQQRDKEDPCKSDDDIDTATTQEEAQRGTRMGQRDNTTGTTGPMVTTPTGNNGADGDKNNKGGTKGNNHKRRAKK